MVTSNLSVPHLHDDTVALAYLEAAFWPDGPIRPRCGATDRIYALKGESTRPGVKGCGYCRKPFAVMVGTIFGRSHVPLHEWSQAICPMTPSEKGISAHQLHRILGVTLKAAWLMSHRVREAMRDGGIGPLGHFGGAGNAVEAEETSIGRKEGAETPKGGYSHKNAVLALAERGGKVGRVHVDGVTSEEAGRHVRENVAREARLTTDEGRHYRQVGQEFAGHSRAHHTAGEYVGREDATIHTDTVEGFFPIFKRGMKGVYQRCKEKHLHRHVAEFGFRHNDRIALGVDDQERAAAASKGSKGKRLTYRRPDQAR